MRIIRAGEANFQEYWLRFLRRNKNSTWRYLWSRIQYQKYFMGDLLEKDLSFIYLEGSEPILICPLFLERRDNRRSLSSANGYLEAPLIKQDLPNKRSRKMERECFQQIDQLALDYEARTARFMVDPLGDPPRYNFLLRYGYLDSSIATSIVDLRLDLSVLWADLRKSYKGLINRALKKYRVTVVDSSDPDEGVFNRYVALHHKAAGKITRPMKTFDMQLDRIRNDESALIGLQEDDRFVAFSFFSHYNGGIYYGSMADDPDYDAVVPFEHCMIWKAIEYYKERNFERLETGAQQFGHQVFDLPEPKNLSISFYKRGFGGNIIAVYRGIKFFDKTDLKAHLDRFFQKYDSSLVFHQ